jgi:hypothetical protein
MKKLLIIPIVLYFILACNNNVDRKNEITAFSMQDFVTIIRDSSFEKFIALVNKPNYELDSSFGEENGIHYSAADTTSDDGDFINVQMTSDRHVHFLNFTTSNKSLYLHLKRQIKEMGFETIDDESELKEFKLDKIYLSLSILDKEPPTSYMFSFVRDNRKAPFK